MNLLHRRSDKRESGQSLVEFSLAITIFLVLVMGIFDFGRAVYQYNGVSEAAREITRAASVHPGTSFANASGWSDEVKAVVATQKKLIPGLGDPVITCVDISGATVSGACSASDGDSVKVTISAPWTPITPLLGLTGTWNLSSSSSAVTQ